MQFFKALFVGVAALSSVVTAQSKSLYFTSTPSDVTVGHQMQITYMAPSVHQPVTIKLRSGKSDNLHTISVLTQTATGGKFNWTPSSELRSGKNYALYISQGSEENYTDEFSIDNPKAVTNSAYKATPAPMYTATITGHAASMSSGLSIPMTRNHTFSSATLAPTSTIVTSAMTTTASPSATSSKGAAANLNSNLALVFGAVAAVAAFA